MHMHSDLEAEVNRIQVQVSNNRVVLYSELLTRVSFIVFYNYLFIVKKTDSLSVNITTQAWSN